jgi:apoptosis-inducing factor 3
MAENDDAVVGLDLARGVALSDLADGSILAGHVGNERVLLVRHGDEFFAVGAECTHYHAPLADGLLVGTELRCPWHHACFDLRSGEAIRAPALAPLACWSVERDGGRISVRAKRDAPAVSRGAATTSGQPRRIVIIGGGAAGFGAAEMLRREGYDGSIVMLSSEEAAPVDRPNLSKDYLAGTAPEDWLPLRPDGYYAENGIELRLGTEVGRIAPERSEVILADGSRIDYDRLLLATGAEPVRLSLPGATQSNVHTLRSVADSRAIIAQAANARRAVVLGASFIGLEVAAALRARKIDVHVIAPESRPMERILGAEMGDFVRSLHEEHGVVFHLGETAAAIEPGQIRLKGGSRLSADLVVAGVGVRPRTVLAEQAGLTTDRGVQVDEFLETNATGIFAAGDIARWPDPHSGKHIRVEHWAVAERQGQTAALNMLGRRQRFTAVPFFWSQHYDVPINYVGHAESWDAIEVEGSIAGRDCLLRYKLGDRVAAVASIFRDLDNLRAEVAMEDALAR